MGRVVLFQLLSGLDLDQEGCPGAWIPWPVGLPGPWAELHHAAMGKAMQHSERIRTAGSQPVSREERGLRNRDEEVSARAGFLVQVRLDRALSLLSPGLFMVLSLLSIVYGALRCNILAIKIKYDEYDVKVKPLAYVCIFLWRSFEIATRVIVLVLFTSVLKAWVVMVVLINFFSFFLYPWILFWCSGSPFPENIEKALSRVGTTIVLGFLTLLYAGINMFCWSAVQLKINNPDLISKSQNWYRLLVYYMLRFIENAVLLLMWYLYKTDIYMYVCAPLLILQLLVGYCTAILFMLVFYQFFHPCKKLFSSTVSEGFQEWLKCVCCHCRQRKSHESVGKADQRSVGDRDETPSSSKISSVPSQILNTEELCSA